MAAAGCGGGRSVLERAEVDRSLLTSATSAPAADSTATSDAVTIRNAVSSVNLDSLGATGLAWANADTGSHGMISSIVETRDAGMACRRFTASRQAFDGIAMYQGDTCLGSGGNWMIRAFERM